MGKLYNEEFESCLTAQLEQVDARAFIERMDLAYALADIVICRAGALTISELCLAGKAAILVPSPMVAEDHQTKNAMALVEKEAALLVEDKKASSELINRAFETLDNKDLCKILEKNINHLGKPNAADDIVNELFELMEK